MRRIFFLNQLFDPSFQNQKRSAAALRALNALREEITQLKDSLRSVHVFVGNRAAHSGRMNADFFRHFLDHHGLEQINTVVQKFSLPSNDGIANLQNGLPALLNVLDELHRRLIAFFYIGADFFFYSVAMIEEAAIGGTHAKLRK